MPALLGHLRERLDVRSATSEAPDEDELRAAVHATGWLLGLVGAGLGSDLLFERRERRGLELTARALALQLPRPLAPDPASLPRLAPTAESWAWSLRFALLLEAWLEVGADGSGTTELAWRMEGTEGGHRLIFEGPRPEEARLVALAAGRLAGADGSLEFPAGVLEDPGT